MTREVGEAQTGTEEGPRRDILAELDMAGMASERGPGREEAKGERIEEEGRD